MSNFLHSRILPLVLGSATAILASTSPANALNFNFSLTNTQGNVSGTVTGTIEGLSDNATSAATDIIITSVPNGLNINPAAATPFSIFSYMAARGGTGPSQNSFTVNNGVITNDQFEYVIGSGSYQLYLGGGAGPYNFINLDGADTNYVYGPNGNLVASYSSASSAAVPFDIPGGATIPALGSVLALGVMRKARKSTSNTFSITTTEKVN